MPPSGVMLWSRSVFVPEGGINPSPTEGGANSRGGIHASLWYYVCRQLVFAPEGGINPSPTEDK